MKYCEVNLPALDNNCCEPQIKAIYYFQLNDFAVDRDGNLRLKRKYGKYNRVPTKQIVGK